MNTPSASVAERRARLARLSARLFPMAAAALAAAAIAAPSAQAIQPNAPALTETNPPSPSTALKPLIRGSSDGVITSVAHPLAAAVGPIGMATKNPSFIVTIYAGDATCTEPAAIAATGTAAELEGAGIQVDEDVEADSVTTFYANQTDPEEPGSPSVCSKGLPYRQVTTPPEPPVFSAVIPASPANDNFPRLTGTADPESTVDIYTTPSCEPGTKVGTGKGAAFAGAGIQASVPDNSTAAFYAKATLAGLTSACSSSTISYQEVTTAEEPGGGGEGPGGGPPSPNPPGKPPAPTLRTIPGGRANDNTPLVTGSAPGAATVKVFGGAGCKGRVLTKGTASQFAAGLPVQVADNTTLSFYGTSVDGGGDESACSPAPAVYVEDSIAPLTRITGGPGVKTRRRTAVFRFADVTSDPSTSFLCKLDRRGWRSCHAPLRLRRLGHRSHVVRVKAVDGAGNREARGAKRRFRVIGR